MKTTPLPNIWPAVHAGIMLVVFAIEPFLIPPLVWPWPLLFPLAAYAAIVLIIPPLRRTALRLPLGRVTAQSALAGLVLSVATIVVLLAFQSIAQPDLTGLAARLPTTIFDSIVIAAICFSVGNALLEELIFRGVLYEAFEAEWGIMMAIGVTSAFFGICHYGGGYPPGPVGALLAGAYGVALGLLRWWSGGLLLTVLCDATADGAIFWMAMFEDAWQ